MQMLSREKHQEKSQYESIFLFNWQHKLNFSALEMLLCIILHAYTCVILFDFLIDDEWRDWSTEHKWKAITNSKPGPF